MKQTLRHSLLALVMALAIFLPQANNAQAASWHAPLGWRWTIARICRNGVKVTMRLDPSDNPQAKGTLTITYVAKQTSVSGATSQPRKYTGTPTLGSQYGSVTITAKPRRLPLSWTDDETGTSGIAYVYGIGNLKWMPELPIGTPVAIKWEITPTQNFKYFLGQVTNCQLP